MRVTESIASVDYWTYDNTCGLNNVGEYGMSVEDRENVRILEFPKTIRYNGKSYRVTRIWFNNLCWRGGILVRTFPKLKKVKVPKELECELQSLKCDDIELVLY